MDEDKQELKILSPDSIREAKAWSVIEDGHSVMDALEAIGIKEATFKNGAYFRAGKKDRTIVRKGLMVVETDTEIQLRFPKKGITSDELVIAEEFKPTQKMIAAYGGKSQSTVSQKRKKAKES